MNYVQIQEVSVEIASVLEQYKVTENDVACVFKVVREHLAAKKKINMKSMSILAMNSRIRTPEDCFYGW